MAEYSEYIIYGGIIVALSYFFTILVFDLLLRGFVPFITARPWVVEQIMGNINISQSNPVMIAFSTGRSGVFHDLEKKYPTATMLGVEPAFFPYVVAKIQAVIRRTRIKVVRQAVHRVDIKDADFIYCHLYPDDLRDLGEKFKFECKPGTQIVSTGFNIPYLTPKKVIDLPDRKGRLDWLSRNQKLFQSKQKKYKKEKKAYLYEI
jgi:hypothetical protein